jgi:RimJ/RimL family protein N-acetyltransferase
MIQLEPFNPSDFDLFISWINNKELLLQIAGTYFSYPLTATQLQKYLQDENSHAFSMVDEASGKVIGHAEIIMQGNNVCKLDKILIGDTTSRGKGIGQQVINELLAFSFNHLLAEKVELYVYDWNTGAIKLYEINGFAINNDKLIFTEVHGIFWKALNMTIDKEKWLKK